MRAGGLREGTVLSGPVSNAQGEGGRRRTRRARHSLALGVGLVACGCARAAAVGADPGDVVVAGGADAAGHEYTWTLTNRGRSPIVEVRIPHYRAALFLTPPGWSTEGSTSIVNVGVADQPGECVGRAPSEPEGIPPGKSGVFRAQIASAGAARGVGTVRVRLADGRELSIPGVEIPQPERLGDKYVALVGLGLIFGFLILVQALRRPRRRATSS